MKPPTRVVLGSAMLVGLLILGSCAAPESRSLPASPEPGASKGSDAAASRGPRKKADAKRGTNGGRKEDRVESADPVTEGSEEGPREEADGSRPWVSAVDDPRGDPDSRGDHPGYADLTAVTVEGGAAKVTFTVSGAGGFPAEMPDQDSSAFVTVSFRRSGDDYFLQGEATTSGWSPSISKNGRSIEYRGRFVVEGDRMTFAIPWADAGGLGRFRWVAESSWTRATTLETYYAFDRAPGSGMRRFPDR